MQNVNTIYKSLHGDYGWYKDIYMPTIVAVLKSGSFSHWTFITYIEWLAILGTIWKTEKEIMMQE